MRLPAAARGVMIAEPRPHNMVARRAEGGLTLVEVVVALAVGAVASVVAYTTILTANAMIQSNAQRLDAEAWAVDTAWDLFHTFDFERVALATNLPPRSPPAASLLSPASELRAMIVPVPGAVSPYAWDVEVRVKRARVGLGGMRAPSTHDVVYRVTRYAIGRP